MRRFAIAFALLATASTTGNFRNPANTASGESTNQIAWRVRGGRAS